MNTYAHLQKSLPSIENHLNYRFKDKSLLCLAFIHSSFVNESRNFIKCNERLEFLGDAILGLIVSDFLYSRFPHYLEGKLSYIRACLVDTSACAFYLQKIDLESFLLMGKGEARNAGKGRSTTLANLFEAIIGAIYIDGGIEEAKSFIFGHFKEEMLHIIENPLRNWKAELQDFCQKNYQKVPEYVVVEERGPEHLKTFFVEVKLEGKKLGMGQGMSKKEAEQRAAKEAIYKSSP